MIPLRFFFFFWKVSLWIDEMLDKWVELLVLCNSSTIFLFFFFIFFKFSFYYLWNLGFVLEGTVVLQSQKQGQW